MFPIRDHNPSAITPVVTVALIAANLAIHLYVVSLPSDREIHLTRLFNAPRALLFEAMNTPEDNGRGQSADRKRRGVTAGDRQECRQRRRRSVRARGRHQHRIPRRRPCSRARGSRLRAG